MTVPTNAPDWAPHESLHEAAHAYLRDPDLALDAVLVAPGKPPRHIEGAFEA